MLLSGMWFSEHRPRRLSSSARKRASFGRICTIQMKVRFHFSSWHRMRHFDSLVYVFCPEETLARVFSDVLMVNNALAVLKEKVLSWNSSQSMNEIKRRMSSEPFGSGIMPSAFLRPAIIHFGRQIGHQSIGITLTTKVQTRFQS